jgi:hypothetical protein
LSDFVTPWACLKGTKRTFSDLERATAQAPAESQPHFDSFAIFLAAILQWTLAVTMMRRGPGEEGLPNTNSQSRDRDWELVLDARREVAEKREGESDDDHAARMRAAWSSYLWFSPLQGRLYVETLLEVCGMYGDAVVFRYDALLRKQWAARASLGDVVFDWTRELGSVHEDLLRQAKATSARRPGSPPADDAEVASTASAKKKRTASSKKKKGKQADAATASRSLRTHAKRSTMACRFMQTSGSCPQGDKCSYRHDGVSPIPGQLAITAGPGTSAAVPVHAVVPQGAGRGRGV